MFGGVGNDTLIGGQGSDVYYATAGKDIIYGFEDNVDTIDMWGTAFSSSADAIAFVDNYGAIVGNNAVFTYGGQTLIVSGVTDLTMFYDDVI